MKHKHPLLGYRHSMYRTERRRHRMRRTSIILAMLAVLALPVMVWAQGNGETIIPPEAQWTPTPPARQSVDPARLARLLREKGVLSDQEYAELTRPHVSSPSQPGQARVWTWDEIDHNPVLRAGRGGGD